MIKLNEIMFGVIEIPEQENECISLPDLRVHHLGLLYMFLDSSKYNSLEVITKISKDFLDYNKHPVSVNPMIFKEIINRTEGSDLGNYFNLRVPGVWKLGEDYKLLDKTEESRLEDTLSKIIL